MYWDHQAAAWDHTALLVASQSSKPINPATLNPFRRPVTTTAMRPAELHALAASLEARNRAKAT